MIAVSNILLSDGRREITEEHTFADGSVRRRHFVLPVGGDLAAVLAAHGDQADKAAKLNEAERYWDRMDRIDLITITPKFSTRNEVWRYLLRRVRKERGERGIHLVALIQHIDANFTTNQILNFSGFTAQQWNALKSRAVKLATLKAAIEDDDADVLDETDDSAPADEF